jgi:type III restriction enzyme
MDYALNDNTKIGGVSEAVKGKFKVAGGRDMLAMVTRINDLRNTFVAHQEKEITDTKDAQQHLVERIAGLKALTEASE